MSLKDQILEQYINNKLTDLEKTIDSIAPTPVRHRLSELIVEMRRTMKDFDQSNSPWQ